MKAEIREKILLAEFPEITAGIVNWPMSAIRLESADRKKVIAAASKILSKWKIYTDESLQVRSVSTGVTSNRIEHHTITPIASKKDSLYVLDLALRDNNESEEHPGGIFHPHQNLHHIKKENIGLIEVMGLAILPPRLKSELKEVEKYLLGVSNKVKDIHLEWAKQLKKEFDITKENVETQVLAAVGKVFVQVLQDAGVFKDTAEGHAGFMRFIDFLNE